MNKIPILFDHEGQAFKGSFDEVQGSGTSKTWHLMINNFYLGKLRLIDSGWVFDPTPQNESMAELANFFGDHVTDWYNENV